MTDMIEKVAKALYKSTWDGYEIDDEQIQTEWDLSTRTRVRSRFAARAAIEAMREPTPSMCEVGDDGYYGMSGYDVWQAMIDAALEKDKQEAAE